MALNKFYQKQPWEQETVRLDWSNRISSVPLSGYAISAVAVVVYDTDGNDVSSSMLEGDPSYSGNYAYATFKGGTDGQKYYARFRITLTKDAADTQYQEEDLIIVVKQEGKG